MMSVGSSSPDVGTCLGGRKAGQTTREERSKIKKPGIAAGPFFVVQVNSLARLRCLVLDRLFLLGGLGGAATRALGERRLDLLDRLGLGDALDGCDLAREPVERSFIELTLGVGLLRLRLRAI